MEELFFFSWRREIGIGAGFCCDRVQERLTALGMVMNYRSSVLLPVGRYHRWESRGQSERVVYISIEGEKKVGEKREEEKEARPRYRLTHASMTQAVTSCHSRRGG